jgi:hypothetical protein
MGWDGMGLDWIGSHGPVFFRTVMTLLHESFGSSDVSLNRHPNELPLHAIYFINLSVSNTQTQFSRFSIDYIKQCFFSFFSSIHFKLEQMSFCQFAVHKCDRIPELGGAFEKERGVFRSSVVLLIHSISPGSGHQHSPFPHH